MSTPPKDLWPDFNKDLWKKGEDAIMRKFGNSFIQEYIPNPYSDTSSSVTATRMYEREITVESIAKNVKEMEARLNGVINARGKMTGEFENPEAIEEVAEKETPPEDLKYFDPKDLDI